MTDLPPRTSLLKPCPRCGADPASSHGVKITEQRMTMPRTGRANQGGGKIISVTLTHTCVKHQGILYTDTTIVAFTFEEAATEWNRASDRPA